MCKNISEGRGREEHSTRMKRTGHILVCLEPQQGRRTLGHCPERLLLSQEGVPSELAIQWCIVLACEPIVSCLGILQASGNALVPWVESVYTWTLASATEQNASWFVFHRPVDQHTTGGNSGWQCSYIPREQHVCLCSESVILSAREAQLYGSS